MITENFSFLSHDRKTRIHAVRWLPNNRRVTGVLQIIHGMCEYMERYQSFAEYLTGKGYLVVGMDLVGHGQSVSFKGDWGFFREKDPSGLLIEDIHTLEQMTREENPDIPYFIFGHSMGSYILRKYLTIYPEGLSGAIICGTGYMQPAVTAGGLALIALLRRIRGWKYRSPMLEQLAFGKSYASFDMTGTEPANSWLTKDQEIVRKYYRTPECTFHFTLNGYQGLLECVFFDCRQKNADRIPADLPLYLVSGAEDPVGDAGVGVMKVYDMLEKADRKDLMVHLFEGDRHEILNELDRDMVYQDLADWMDRRKGNPA